ncbi:MAG: DNA helicase RecQ [Bacteroidales bacterium]|jgi:ATP-dependent DNA helicase RecQ|nr:DNA helicase RecQ [Bacteroidales bacterium]
MEFSSEILHSELKRIFGFDRFKGTQEEVISSLLAGRDTFVIMPTGGGKSLCYQLPALLLPGTAVIVSPLISLMKNQVDAVRNFGSEFGVAHYLNSSLNKIEMAKVKEEILEGKTKLLYVAPESLTKKDNVVFFRKVKVSFYAIDEAHCISEWGHDFRQEYRRLRPLINEIGHTVPVMALTATATPKVQKDIQKNLNMQNAQVFISSFNRPNLYYEVRPKTKNIDKDVVRYIRENSGKSGIVYCLSRKRVEEFAQVLQTNGIRALPYHAGLEQQVRAENQDRFLNEDVNVIVATIAFGMGIDKPDVRFVIHYNMPKSLEGYYQETGRAGRDGGEGHCIAFFNHEDIMKLENFIRKEKGIADQEIAIQLIAETVSYAETGMCRRKNILHYFGEVFEIKHCGYCDNCLHPKEKIDVTEDVLTILETMEEMTQGYKTKHICHVIIGQTTAQIKNHKHHDLSAFGQGQEKDISHWNSVVRQCLMEHLIEKDMENYGTVKMTGKGRNYLGNPYPITIAKDRNFEDEEPITLIGKEGDEQLLLLLKEELRVLAKKQNVSSWAILTEPSLIDMTVQYPITMEEMSQISGMGAVKAAKYGQSFINIIKRYVEENEIERPQDLVVKTIVNKSGLKVYIIQNIDRKLPLEDIAKAKGLTMDDLITEMERIVASGTKININYYIKECLDRYHVEDIYDYFSEAESDCAEECLKELDENEYTLEEVRLVRLKYLTEVGF